jgi:hypothetical protein
MGYSKEWILGSKGALRISRAICVVACCGLIVSMGLVVFDLIYWRQLSGATILLIPAIPAIAAGQIWGLMVLGARRPQNVRKTRWSYRVSARPDETTAREFFFDGLPRLPSYALLALAALGWLAAMTAWPLLINGGPASGTAGCPYRLNNHGVYSCVSRRTFNHAGAASQRFASGILAGFFAIHLGMSAAELARRRRATSNPTFEGGAPVRGFQ